MADQEKKAPDVMHGRSFAGENVASTEREQTRDRERVARHGDTGDEINEVTDAEMEVREANGEGPGGRRDQS